MEMQSIRQIFKKSTFWLGQRAAGFWIMSTFGTAITTYALYATDILKQYAPFSYAVIALGTFLLICIGYAIYAWGYTKYRLVRFEERRSQSLAINPLAKTFSQQRINLHDFYHPFFRPIENARFEYCELFGPSSIHLRDGYAHGSMTDCEIIIDRDDRTIKNVIPFFNCQFIECDFYRVILYMSIKQYNELPDKIKKIAPIVSDGRIGDI